MRKNYIRQIIGFLKANLRIQSRNLLLLSLGFLIPILMIFGFQFISTNSFQKIKVGIERLEQAELDLFEKAITTIDPKDQKKTYGDDLFEIVFLDKNDIDKRLSNNEIDVKVKIITGNTISYQVTTKDTFSFKNIATKHYVESRLNKALIESKNINPGKKVESQIFKIGSGEYLTPLLPVILAFMIALATSSLSEMNIFNSKENLALRRIFVAPTYPSAYFFGVSLSKIIFCFVQIIFVIALMMIGFGYAPANLISFIPQVLFLVVITIVVYIMQYLLLASIIKKDKTLGMVHTTILAIQFILISGYLPVKSSQALDAFVAFLPLGAFQRAAGYMASGFSMFRFEVLPSVLVLMIWLLVFGFVSSRQFKLRN
jgi:ABC-type multidrug transport system permease subunit